ncbi:acyltransferase family protein [Novipirellula sp. SH528]|uniref:acyltransferase family protein n=1 Tax=Novipirellula sp. SH528 TaxID=3454466 RepID=UPI003F9F3103
MTLACSLEVPEHLSTAGEPTPETTKPKIETLQVLRAVAALCVVVFHANDIAYFLKLTETPHFILMHLGDLGVNLFFVLSGFIIFYIHAKDLGLPDRARRYTWRRFSRVWPLYALITLANCGVLFVIGSNQVSGTEIVSSLLFLQAKPIVNVGWTLVHEAFFYVLFGIAIVGGRKFGMWLVTIFASVAIYTQWTTGPSESLYGWIFATQKWYFISGLGLACLLTDQTKTQADTSARKFAWTLFGLLIATAVIVGILGSAADELSFHLTMSIALAAMVGLSVWSERTINLRMPRLLVYLGDASYSIYLVHSSAIYHLVKLTKKFLPSLCANHLTLTLCCISFIAILAGISCYELVEKRLVRWFR